jgi:hypothetical protein
VGIRRQVQDVLSILHTTEETNHRDSGGEPVIQSRELRDHACMLEHVGALQAFWV